MNLSIDIVLTGLLIVSTIVGLATEGVKKVLDEHSITYRANTLAGIISVVVAAAVGVAYAVITGAEINAQVVVYLVTLIILSWLCAMTGYDKVIQTITQIKGGE